MKGPGRPGNGVRLLRGGVRRAAGRWWDIESFLQQAALSGRRGRQLSAPYFPGREELTTIRTTLERILLDNIVPFWYPSTIDTVNGGYLANHDLESRWKGPENKGIVVQARNLWFYSRLARSEYGQPEHLRAATHGYDFIKGSLWDSEFGGFYWTVDPSGKTAIHSYKHAYGQAMALYALSEYAVASGDASATALAGTVFWTLEDHAHDGDHGGYREFFRRDWGGLPTDDANPLGAYSTADVKTMNTHVHLLESMTRYRSLASDSPVCQRLLELIVVMTSSTVNKKVGAFRQVFLADWTPLTDGGSDRVSYGHDVEAIWLLMDAIRAAGLPDSLLLDFYRTVFGYAMRYGFDRRAGGLYLEGPPRRMADQRQKVWWAQAEVLLSALHMYRATGERRYFECFRHTLDWIVTRQVDWGNKEWFQYVYNSQPGGVKSGPWKDPYHQGRAMLECLRLLRELEGDRRR